MLARITLGMTQAIDAVAHHQAHGARIEIRPHRFSTETLFGLEEGLGHFVQRGLPRDCFERAVTLGADASQWHGETIGMVDAFGVARDLAADHAGGIGVSARAAHTADGVGVDALDFERTGRGAIVRAGAVMEWHA